MTSGDASARSDQEIAELVEVEFSLVYAAVRRYASRPSDDHRAVMSDAMFGLLLAAREWDPEVSRFGPWAANRVKWKVLEGLKERRTGFTVSGERAYLVSMDQPVSDESARTVADFIADPFDAFAAFDDARQDDDDRAWLAEMLDQLPHDQQEVLGLALTGLSPADIADHLSVHVVTVRERARLATAALRRWYQLATTRPDIPPLPTQGLFGMTQPICTVCGRQPLDPTAQLCRSCLDQLEKALEAVAMTRSRARAHETYDGGLLADLDITMSGGAVIDAIASRRPPPPSKEAAERVALRAIHHAARHTGHRRAMGGTCTRCGDIWPCSKVALGAEPTLEDQKTGYTQAEHFAKLKTELRSELGRWVTTLQVQLPVRPKPIDHRPDRTVLRWVSNVGPKALATALLREHERLAHHEHAAAMHYGITRIVDRCQRATDRPPERFVVGRCYRDPDRCNAVLEASTPTGVVTCQSCGESYDVETVRNFALEAIRDYLMSATEISQALNTFGQHVTVSMITGYAYRGRIVSHGRDSDGRPTYRVGDVLEIVDEMNEKRKAMAS